MKKFLYKIWSKFLTCFGDIKCFSWPFWLIYDPDDFQITGEKLLDIMNVIQPGDILLRGYRHYLDGKFIGMFGINIKDSIIGGDWSHGAIYVGDNTVIHAIAEGVSTVNIVDFCRCDRIAIFRPKKYQKQAISIAKKFLKDKVPYDFGFQYGASSLYCFELAALSYPKLDIPKLSFKKFFGLISKEDVYLAKSFVDSPDLKLVFCSNPKFGIDVCENN